MKKKFDYLIVGAGLFGSVCAEQLSKKGKEVLVIEKRSHIGGNCFTYDFPGTNINVHKYGTHIFHTRKKKVWDYVCRFTNMNRYQHRVLTTHNDKIYSMPINLGTINSFFNVNIKPYEFDQFIRSKQIKKTNINNLEDKILSLVGVELYEAFIKGYTIKQWNCNPQDLPADIITRLPVRSSYFDSYFDDIYQGIPEGGYTPIFKRMLSHAKLICGVDFLCEHEYWTNQCCNVIYTGPIDKYFNYKHGKLGWRSLRFETKLLNIDDQQGTSVMNYADINIPYTRIHEFKHLHREVQHTSNVTIISCEYPVDVVDEEDPYYPIRSQTDIAIMKAYEKLMNKDTKTIFGGRLATYRYYDMDTVIDLALTLTSNL